MEFESPSAFLILLLLPLLVWWHRRKNLPGGIGFSTVPAVGRSWRQRGAFLPLGMRVLVLLLLITSLARPQKEDRETVHESKEGIAIEMVVDRSGSMSAGMDFQGEQLNRLEVVRRVFRKFVLGDGHDFSGRPDDLVGIVSFAAYAETICPLTLAHETFPGFLESLQLGGGTAIGDAIALAAARLQTTPPLADQKALHADTPDKLKSRVMILLTDGGNNAGRRAPLSAAQLAAQWGIRIYTIGIGGRNQPPADVPPSPVPSPSLLFGESVNEELLESIAATTGGFFRMAEDGEGLKSICQEIDRLERSKVDTIRLGQQKELFPPLTLLALLLGAAETGLQCTLFRRIP